MRERRCDHDVTPGRGTGPRMSACRRARTPRTPATRRISPAPDVAHNSSSRDITASAVSSSRAVMSRTTKPGPDTCTSSIRSTPYTTLSTPGRLTGGMHTTYTRDSCRSGTYRQDAFTLRGASRLAACQYRPQYAAYAAIRAASWRARLLPGWPRHPEGWHCRRTLSACLDMAHRSETALRKSRVRASLSLGSAELSRMAPCGRRQLDETVTGASLRERG